MQKKKRTWFHLHWFDCKLDTSRWFVIDSLNFFAQDPGFRTLTSPHWEHGSVHQLFQPEHHAPGVGRFGLRLRMISSTMFSTGSFRWNCLAKAAPLWAIWSKLEVWRKWGSILGGLSQIMYLRSLFTVLFLKSGELQITEWKYPSWDQTTFVKYINSFRGRLSQPNTQNSRNDRLRTTQGEPTNAEKNCYNFSIASCMYEHVDVYKHGILNS